MSNCHVNEIFKTSLGLVAILDFADKKYPLIGKKIKNANGYVWQIIGSGLGKPIELTNFKFNPKFNDNLYDCLLEPINHTEELNIGEILEME